VNNTCGLRRQSVCFVGCRVTGSLVRCGEGQCKANQNGCENEVRLVNRWRNPVAADQRPEERSECNCVGRPQQQLDRRSPQSRVAPGTVNCSATAVTIKTILRQYLVQLGIQNRISGRCHVLCA